MPDEIEGADAPASAAPEAVPPAEPPRKIAVVGEIPFSGAALVRALLEKGFSARVLCPDDACEGRIRQLKPSGAATLDIVRGSLDSVVAIAEALAGAYGVCMLSPITMNGRRYRADSHIQDVRRVLDAAEHAAIRKLAYHSALGAHPRAPSRALRDSAEAEELVHESRCEDFRIRTGPLMGRGDGFLTEIADTVRRSSLLLPVYGYGSTALQPLHVDDMGRCVARLFREGSGELAPGVYCLAGPETTTLLDLLDRAAETLGSFKIKLHPPLFVLKLLTALRRKSAFEERVNLLFEPYCTEQNDALTLLNSGEKLITAKQAQEEVLAGAPA